jgi:hypothetical protein
MKACPVCANEAATFASQGGQASGLRRRSWYVSCPTCPTSFDISLELLHQLAGSSAQAAQLRARWVRLMAEAAKRGDKMTHLY